MDLTGRTRNPLRYGLQRRRRRRSGAAVRLLFIVVLAALLVLALPRVVRVLARAAEPPVAVTVTVAPGDSLWTIAERHAEPGEDIRRVVHRIRRHNGLDGGLVHPGMVLQVPPPPGLF